MTSKNRLYILALCLGTIVPIGYAQQPSSSNDNPTVADGDWPSYNRTLTSERYSPLKQINAQNQLTPYDFHDWDLAATPALIKTTGGKNLIVAAGKDGVLHAVNPSQKQLWKQNTGAPIAGGVITYLVRDKQYVAVAAGLTSESWLTGGSNAKGAIYALP